MWAGQNSINRKNMEIGDTVFANYIDEKHKGFIIGVVPYHNNKEKLIYTHKSPYEFIGADGNFSDWERYFKPCRLLLTEKVHIYRYEQK